MNLNKKIAIGFMFVTATLFAYEPSVYGAGDINSATPYGLTQTEQAVLNNKKTIQKLFNRLTEQQRKIDGLTSIIKGQNREIVELKEKLEVEVNSRASHAMDNNRTYSLLLELSQTVDNINNNFVSREELQNSLAGGNAVENLNASTIPAGVPIGVSPDENYRKGVQLFSSRSYSAAKSHFDEALAQNYKAAPTNYYLGEIAYYTQNYSDAIAYYKQSASLYENASYMSVLYLHTAIALEQTGDVSQAKVFYKYVIDNYPNTKSASIAQNHI